jgi:hypothetical protein
MARKVEIVTLRTSTDPCPDTRTCPSIHALVDRPERRYVITKQIADAAEIEAFAHLVSDDEQVGWLPAELIPEV